MSDRYIEKSFVYVLCISLLLHLGVFAGLYFFPSATPPLPKEPVFIDLKIPPVPKQVPVKKPPRQIINDLSKSKKAEPKENAVKPTDLDINKHYHTPPKGRQAPPESRDSKKDPARPLVESGESVSSLLKPKKTPAPPRLQNDFTLRKIEDQIRNKLNSQKKSEGVGVGDVTDLSLLSFSGRFFDGANNHLVYPPQAKRLGLEGVGAGEVTFNRKGEIIDIHFTYSSGKEFEEAVFNALKNTVTGPLPKAYTHDTATLPFVYVFRLPPQEQR